MMLVKIDEVGGQIMNILPYIIQILIYLFVIYHLFSIKASYEHRQRINEHLLIAIIVLSLLALKGEYVKNVIGTATYLAVVGAGMWYFLLQLRKDELSVHTPIGYLSFYFLILFIVLITGNSLSILFPEVFILAVLFGMVNAGRKISFAISLMTATTIGLLYLHDPVSTVMLSRVSVTIVLLIVIPQIAGYVYKKRIDDARSQWMNSEENS
jgi:hypothetical protein